MAPKYQKRTLEPADLKTPDKLLGTVNRLSETMAALTDGGVSFANLRKHVVEASITPPDGWASLTFGAGGFSRHPAATFPPPGALVYQLGGQRRAKLRGLLTRGAAPAFGAVVADIPTAKWQGRHATDGDGAHAFLETRVNGTLTYGGGGVGTLSLEGIDYETTAQVPLWATPVDVTLTQEGQQDFGQPLFVLTLSATRADRVPCYPEPVPVWESPILGDGRTRRRVLRLLRLGGLEPGIRHTVRFLAVYE